ncbi:ATP-binding cassette domain-containing protein [Ramlibacter sp. MMS24-I3-19]|uniref:ATP-binding cassette domain-containing protein n=1 Tax=Ramlibacter sp. MMS24-I3-19 TaxID=3416606 RepID=UPI003D03F50D
MVLEVGCELGIPKTIQLLLSDTGPVWLPLSGSFLALLLAILYVFRFFASLCSTWSLQVNEWKIGGVLRGALLDSQLRRRRVIQTDAGGTVELLENDVSRARALLGSTVPALLVSGFTILGALVVVAYSNAYVALWLVIITVTTIYSLDAIRRRASAAWEAAGAARKRTISFAESVFAGSLDVFANDHRTFVSRVLDRLIAQQMQTVGAAYTRERLVWPFAIALFGLCHAVSFAILTYSSVADPALFVAVFLYTELIRRPVEATVGTFANLQDGLASLHRIATSLHQPDEPSKRSAAQMSRLKMDFWSEPLRYSSASPLISAGTIVVEPGEVVLLQGRTGCGKSTLAQFLAGISQASGPPAHFAGPLPRIAYFGQREPILALSRAENIRLFAPDESLPKALLRSASSLGLLQTDLDVAASPAQSERDTLVLLRGLVCGSDLVIFDEPFAASEASTIKAAATLLRQYLGTRSCIVISHRPEWGDVADRIYTLSSGTMALHQQTRSAARETA